jgi:hypothetical protein
MSDDLLLVGSIPLETAEEVFRQFGPELGPWLPYLPDGEIGERQFWVDGLAYRVFNGHREIETVKWPAPDADGVEVWRPRGSDDEFQFRVKDGVERVRFGDPGWRLGYARDAISSYFVFRQLKRDDVIPSHVRFQVCIPLTFSAFGAFFPDPDDHARVMPGLTTALAAEVANIVRHIPNDDLAIQWDVALENRLVERCLESGDLRRAREEATRLCEPATELCSAIPPEVALGYHLCFGSVNGWPSRQPEDLTGTVLLLNEVAAASARPVDFIHFPTVGKSDESYFRPLADLRVGDARAYVGAIHHLQGPGGLEAQLRTVREFLPDFGLAAPCGFGRAPERPGRLLTDEGDLPPDHIRAILADHLGALEVLEASRQPS